MIDKRMWASQTPLRHFKARTTEMWIFCFVCVESIFYLENRVLNILRLNNSAGFGGRYPEKGRKEGRLKRRNVEHEESNC